MSRAFVKEDAEPAERSTRRRSPSGLPPGARNYMTAAGAEHLRARCAALRAGGDKLDEAVRLEELLASATIVDPPTRHDVVTFGACVTLRGGDGKLAIFRVAGVDEASLAPENVSWLSEAGKTLLGAELGQRVHLPGAEMFSATVVKIS